MRLDRLRRLLWVALLPLSLVWTICARLRRRRGVSASRVSVPVVSVGNIHSGGSGKTPVVMAIVQRYRHLDVAVVSRGYRGRLSSSGAKVDITSPQGAVDYGDEPWMMAQLLDVPVRIGSRRLAQVEAAVADGARAIVLDDGFQHLAVARDLDVVVINCDNPPEEALCLPLGELREPLSALGSASCVVLTPGSAPGGDAQWEKVVREVRPDLPCFRATRVISGLARGAALSPRPEGRFAAFCAIAGPARFRSDVAGLGEPLFFRSFPDHHPYDGAALERLSAEARQAGAAYLVTTDKDWFKVNRLVPEPVLPIFSLRIRYEFPDEFWYLLGSRLDRK